MTKLRSMKKLIATSSEQDRNKYEAKIELFKMILERNELCRLRFNALHRYLRIFKIKKKCHDRMLTDLYALRNTIKIGEIRSFRLIDEAINKRKANIRAEEYASEKSKERLLDYSIASNNVYEFTKATRRKRMQLQKLFNTLQHKDCNNVIKHIRVDYKHYNIEDMRNIIADYEVERILLG